MSQATEKQEENKTTKKGEEASPSGVYKMRLVREYNLTACSQPMTRSSGSSRRGRRRGWVTDRDTIRLLATAAFEKQQKNKKMAVVRLRQAGKQAAAG